MRFETPGAKLQLFGLVMIKLAASQDLAITEHTRETAHLLPGEKPDLRAEVVERLGKDWLFTENIPLAVHSVDELIGTDEEYKVRNMLRSIAVAALS